MATLRSWCIHEDFCEVHVALQGVAVLLRGSLFPRKIGLQLVPVHSYRVLLLRIINSPTMQVF